MNFLVVVVAVSLLGFTEFFYWHWKWLSGEENTFWENCRLKFLSFMFAIFPTMFITAGIDLIVVPLWGVLSGLSSQQWRSGLADMGIVLLCIAGFVLFIVALTGVNVWIEKVKNQRRK